MMNKRAFFILLLLWMAFRATASAYYDPHTQTFLSRDPIREAGGINLYAYCENDPVGNFDPIGLADDGPLDQLNENLGKLELRLRKAGRRGQRSLDIANHGIDHYNREVARIEFKLNAGLDAEYQGTPLETLQQVGIGMLDPVRSLFTTQAADTRPFWQQVMDGDFSPANADPMRNPRLFGSLASSEFMGYGAMSLASRIRLPAVRFSGTDFMAQARARLGAVQAQYGNIEAFGMARRTLGEADIVAGMELNPTEANVFRGGSSLGVRPNDVKVVNGLVQPTRGISLFTRSSGMERFGGAFRIETLPAELRIIQRGQNLQHFEIVPRSPMSLERFNELLESVELQPYEGD